MWPLDDIISFVFDVVHTLFSLFDKVIYWTIDNLINLFNTLASVQLFSSDVIKTFASRLYIFLSIIMIFKVSFSIIQYIINPDTFNDREKGMGKTIQNVLLALVMLVLVEPIFSFAYSVQNRLVNENVIPNIILGIENIDKNKQDRANNQLPFMLISPFIAPNTQVQGIEYNTEKGVYTADGVDMYVLTPVTVKDLTSESKTSYIKGDYNEQFGERLAQYAGRDFSVARYNEAMKNHNYMQLLDMTTAKVGDTKTYLFDYKLLLSTIAGVFVAIMYINFCMDLAIRVTKLGLLELIAPIPIISMVDPKSSKNGMMSKWVKQCLSTFFGLFIRIAAVNFVVYIISIVMEPNESVFVTNNVFVQLFIIFGALMFARELPKLITDLTGFELGGNFNLNPIRRFEEKAIGGRRITSTVAGLTTGAIGGLASGHGFGGRIAGLVGGGLRGAGAGLTGGQGIRQTRDAVVSRRHSLEQARANGSTFRARMNERLNRALGIDTQMDDIKHREEDIARQERNHEFMVKELDDQIAGIEVGQRERRAEMDGNQKISDIVDKMRQFAEQKIKEGKAGEYSTNYLGTQQDINKLQTEIDELVRNNTKKINSLTGLPIVDSETGETIGINDDEIRLKKEKLVEMQTKIADDMKQYVSQYIDSGAHPVINQYLDDYRELCDVYGQEARANASAMDAHATDLKARNSEIQRGFYFDERRKSELENHKHELDEEKELIENRKKRLEEEKRHAQANADAINHANGNNH